MHHTCQQNIHMGNTEFRETIIAMRMYLHLQDAQSARPGRVAILHIRGYHEVARNDQSNYWLFHEEKDSMI